MVVVCGSAFGWMEPTSHEEGKSMKIGSNTHAHILVSSSEQHMLISLLENRGVP